MLGNLRQAGVDVEDFSTLIARYAERIRSDKDKAILDYREALHIEKIRNEFFVRLEELLRKQGKDENG